MGWLGARAQQKLELRKLDQELVPGTARELRFRQQLYVAYIAAADSLYQYVDAPEPHEFKEFRRRVEALRNLDDQMELFAAEAVFDRRAALWEHALKFAEGVWREGRSDFSRQLLARKRDEGWHAHVEARRALIRAMRSDVGPGE